MNLTPISFPPLLQWIELLLVNASVGSEETVQQFISSESLHTLGSGFDQALTLLMQIITKPIATLISM